MFSTDDFTLDCNTCVAANTTACSDCIVSHLLANDAGPIDLQPVPREDPLDEVDRVVALFGRAGLIDAGPEYVSQADFDAASLTVVV